MIDEMDDGLSDYEKDQLRAIDKWKKEEPSVLANALHTILTPLEWIVERVIPQKAIQGLLDGANKAAQWLTDEGDIRRDGDVKYIEDLRHLSLEKSDQLADEVHNWAIGIAITEGAGTGATGLLGIAADIPLVVTLALRTIHKIGLCYGYKLNDEIGKQTVLAILSAASANSIEEKTASLLLLQQLKVILKKATWKAIEKGAENFLAKEGILIATKTLAKQLGINLTKRKALQAIPAIGAIVGGSVNGWYIKEIGWAARREFQERWLVDNGKIIDI